MNKNNNLIKWATLLILLFSFSSYSVNISDAKYIDVTGGLKRKDAEKVFAPLRKKAHQQKFDIVGKLHTGLGLCSGTWLSSYKGHAYILTAAHCIKGHYTGSEMSFWAFSNFSFSLKGKTVALGKTRVFVKSYEGFIPLGGCQKDLAVVKIPIIKAISYPQPIIADDDSFAVKGSFLELTGYGLSGNNSLGQIYGVGKNYGVAQQHSVNKEKGCFSVIAHYFSGGLKNYASAAPGESGGPGWQNRQGQNIVMAVTSNWHGWHVGTSGHILPAIYIKWLKRIVPNLYTFTLSRTLTERHDVTLGDIEKQLKGSAYYVAGLNVDGPKNGIWVYPKNYTRLTTQVTNQQTGKTYTIYIRAQKNTGCGWGQMNNGIYCKPGAIKGNLKIHFSRMDNINLPQGTYKGEFSLWQKGWHHKSYTEEVNIKVDLNLSDEIKALSSDEVDGTVTEKKSFVGQPLDKQVRGSVYYVNGKNVDSDATKGIWNGQFNTWTKLHVLAINEETGELEIINLRGQRIICGLTKMNNGAYCSGPKKGNLKVTYKPEDNKSLPKGKYSSSFSIKALGWHDKSFKKTIVLNLAIVK